MTKREHAQVVAHAVEQAEGCAVLTEASLTTIERALVAYVIDRLNELRREVVVETWEANAKQRILLLIDAALHGEYV